MTSPVEIIISEVESRAVSISSKLPASEIVKSNVVIRSKLGIDSSLNEHLTWLWGMLKSERRFIKRIQEEGAVIKCHCKIKKGCHSIQPNGVEMLHLLGIELEIEAS
jgi:hypothetical protein